jgi:hypothetical protein
MVRDHSEINGQVNKYIVLNWTLKQDVNCIQLGQNGIEWKAVVNMILRTTTTRKATTIIAQTFILMRSCDMQFALA